MRKGVTPMHLPSVVHIRRILLQMTSSFWMTHEVPLSGGRCTHRVSAYMRLSPHGRGRQLGSGLPSASQRLFLVFQSSPHDVLERLKLGRVAAKE